MNFSPALGPPGCSSLYVEISHQPTMIVPPADLLRQVRAGLERAGIFRPDDEILAADVRDIRYAYVLFDRHRPRVLPTILAELERRGADFPGPDERVGRQARVGGTGAARHLAGDPNGRRRQVEGALLARA